jgi:chitinase
VYNAATGLEHELALTRAPTRVSISPDGTRAAVGHDALVSYVDLTTVGTVGAAAPTLLNVPAVVGDLVLDGRGHVFVFPANGNWDMHSIDIATNTQTTRYGPLYAGTRAALHPSGSKIYTANNGLSPDDIQNLDISSGQAVLVRDSPYHGDYEMCGNLWISDDGQRIYTACGRTFSTATVASQDMLYSGAMLLSTANYGYRIASLSEWAAGHEIALVENDRYACDLVPSTGPCWSHLNFYNSDTLNLVSRYSLAPINVSGTHYGQRGRFVFHRPGGSKLLVSETDGVPDRAARYYVSVLP